MTVTLENRVAIVLYCVLYFVDVGVCDTQNCFNVVDFRAADDGFVAVMSNGHGLSLWQLGTLM